MPQRPTCCLERQGFEPIGDATERYDESLLFGLELDVEGARVDVVYIGWG
jgi:hypothetical protein